MDAKSTRNGALIGATIAFLFYAFLSTITPLEGKSVFPTAQVVSDPVAKAVYMNGLPTAMIIFISLEVVGMILGIIGYRILVVSTEPPTPAKTAPLQKK